MINKCFIFMFQTVSKWRRQVQHIKKQREQDDDDTDWVNSVSL